MVIKKDILKDINKLSPEERLKRLKQLEEEIKKEEKITEGIIVKEREVLKEKQITDERLVQNRRKRTKEKKDKESKTITSKSESIKVIEPKVTVLEDVVEQEKISQQQEINMEEVQYHAKFITEVDQALDRMEYMSKEKLDQYSTQARDIYDKLNDAYEHAVGWMRDDIKAEKERMKNMFKWWKDEGDKYSS